MLQFASLGFDASVFEMVMALSSGATLCFATREQLLPGPALLAMLKDEAITIVTFPPSTLSALSDPEWADVMTIIDEDTVRHIIPRLKAAGACGIVEYPLNKIID